MPDVSKVIYDTSGEIIDGPVYSVNGERREVNKVVYGVTTLIDITDSTVTSNNLLRGNVAYSADGSRVVGNIDQTIEHLEVGGTVSLDENDYMEFDDSGGSPSLQAKTNISPTTSSQTITADSGYDGLSSVQINAMPTGTAGTPTATKGAVSNHQVSVTPSVTNTTGYISGGTKTGTAVTVTASELASGNKAIASNGTNIDVVGYSTVSVDVPDNTLVVTVSYNSSTNRFEPDKTYSEISAANSAGKTIVVNCAMVPSIASADGVFGSNKFTYWVREYLDGSEQMLEQEYILNSSGLTKNQEVIYYENAPSSSNNVQAYAGYDTVNVNTYTDTDVTLTVAKSGTYTISWMGWRNTTSGTSGSQLYKNGNAVGTANTSFLNSYGQHVTLTGQSLSQGDVLVVRARSRNASYCMGVGNLIIIQTA